jgi:beta-glucosidase
MIKRILTGVLATFLALAVLGGTSVQTQSAPSTPAQSVGQAKIDALVASMTLDEKLSMLYGTQDPKSYGEAGYLAGVPRLGIPALRLTDGPAGIRTAQPATALPAPVALASTFSPQLAKQYGQILGRDARARYQNVVLAPMVNIVRVPQAGRNFETLGEDPLLAGSLVAPEIEGMQGEGSIATVKHYAFNNQENARMSVSADLDEATMHEIYLPGFEAAVRAGVGSVMASYNRINGTYAAEDPLILNDILREQFGFKGFVMSDWGATHSAVPALRAGMEMEMPSGRNFSSLRAAVDRGELNMPVVDEAVRRILWAMDSVGLLSGAAAARPVPEIPTSTPAARDIAIAGAVLLKNQGNVLPLGKEDVASLAVIGPTAKLVLVGGGGSASVRPMHSESPLDVLQRRVGAAVRIAYAKGYDVDGEVVPADVLRPNATLSFLDKNTLPPGSTLTWTGSVVVPTTGNYVFNVQTSGGRGSLSFTAQTATAGQRGGGAGAGGGRGAAAGPGGAGAPGAAAAGAGREAGAPGGAPAGRGFPGMGAPGGAAPGGLPAGAVMGGFGGTALLPTSDGLSNSSTPVRLTAGQTVPLTVTVSAGGRGAAGPVQARLTWMTPEIQQARIDEAVRAAKAARVAVVFAYDEGTEGRDRASLSLPGYQDALIAAVAAANPRTVVVLNNGAPILMPWTDQVAAILQMWYPGQEGADATVAILLGEASPGGRLPVTFPRRAEDAPTFPPERYPGVNGRGEYSEGIFVGYRWYDKEQIEPLFPFGYGLSYTTFAYSGLSVRPAAGKAGGYDVKFTVKNTGTREGTDVPQVYLGPPPNAPVPMAVKKLVGFERVSLAPGQSRQVIVHVDTWGLSYWSTADHEWKVASGRRTFMLGSSSRNIALKTEVTVGAGR